jgi:hypothetical protein
MICSSCREAARLSVAPEVIYQYLDGRPQETLTGPQAAARMHAECPGGSWCECQHKQVHTGPVFPRA